MTETIERLTFKGGGEPTRLQLESIRLHRERYEFAAAHARGKRVLDIACGCGYGSEMLKEAGADSVVGVDLSPEAIAEAMECFSRDGVRFLQADYRDLNESSNPRFGGAFDAPFDLIVSLETIEHLPDPADFLGTVLRLLRPGGSFVGSVPVTLSMDANPHHLQDFSRSSFRRMLTRGGLRVADSFAQVQPYNPVRVRSEMEENRRDLRPNLGQYYAAHPSKFFLRVYATLRFGFANHYETIAAEKVS